MPTPPATVTAPDSASVLLVSDVISSSPNIPSGSVTLICPKTKSPSMFLPRYV